MMVKSERRAVVLAVVIAAPALAEPMAPVNLGNRPAEMTAQGASRKPAEVLTASGIAAGATVIHVMPGAPDFETAGFKFAGEVPVLRTIGGNSETLVFDAAVRGKTHRFYYRFTKPWKYSVSSSSGRSNQ